ncbi:MMPL family transporter [Metabacillus sediminilitoris]|uniref:MMPL family transporter n=1 Tax=Metabacillus sediminilitoris TaxID=2567941 RepID=A0A4S4C0F6_9BACI|nr:MMPL family transporter [Metabacillus sediminilitoris]QGQ47800.1 MMPL family transporter [Metabacillus sediminilitoris]THF81087.1 MMPL family transporter [Metabacillus sediminilitoris]
MNTIIKGKWFVIVGWIAVVAGLFFLAPNMADLVREKGQISVPDGFSSSLASDILDEVQKQEKAGDSTQVALVFHNENKLSSDEIKEAERAIHLLEDNEELDVKEILTHFNEESLKEQLVSDDGKTILASVTVNWDDRESKVVSDLLYETIKDVKVDHYYTSGWMIDEDVMTSSQEGLKKTEGITVVFILAVLLLVFRSVIAPFIPLITVGITYLASQSIVAILVDTVNFPISNFTQIFLVAILFGIGTDYCILLLSRFKEELAHRESVIEAIVETYRHAGRTVFFSGLAVMIGFAAIGFSQFKLYQSASAVAVGVAVLLIALFTVVPFFMAVLGSKIYWPSKGTLEHKDSKIWEYAGRFSLARPIIALLIVAIVSVPFLLKYDGDLSFNSLEEIGSDVNSIKAFNAISDSFGPGESMPTQIILKNDEEMDSTEYIGLAEKISTELETVDLIDSVRSVTRPTGEKIEDFYVSNQAETLEEGLGKGNDGIEQISEGLAEAETELSNSSPQLKQATDGINELISGTTEINSGMSEIQTNLAKIEAGIRQGSAGSNEIKNGLAEAKAGAEELHAGSGQLLAGYEAASANLGTLYKKYEEVGQGIIGLSGALTQLDADFNALEENEAYPGLASDPAYGKIKGTVQDIAKNQLPNLAGGLTQLNTGLNELSSGVSMANGKFVELIDGQKQISEGLSQLIAGIEQQQAGLEQLANGQGQIVNNMPKITDGLSGVTNGQKQLLDGFGNLDSQMNQLTDGLGQSVDGLNEVSNGLGSAQDYLADLSKTSESSGFYLPEDVLESEEFAQALDTYLSTDRKVMTIDVTFEANPYSNEAIGQVDEINAAIQRATKDTKLENAEVAIGGITSTNADLNTVSNNDYTRTVILMLVGISIILVFLFRSLIMPLYLIGSLILTYYTAMGINEVIFVNILGYTGISWAVPFFGFVILVALGVDYSIFLMDRFNEFKDLTVGEAMLMAMKKMGTVIISAAIILGGTFAAMIPSGMLSLVQIASIVLTGLLLYALIILPLLVPVMVKTFGAANWWPFKRA